MASCARAGRFTTLCDSSEAEKGEPQPQNKRGEIYFGGII